MANERNEHRLTYAQAAKALGISIDAVRMRVRRGKLPSERDEDGTVKVIIDDSQVVPDETDLTEQLRSEVAYLREENQRKDHIIAALIQKVPALEAPSDERRDVSASRDDPVEGYPSTGTPRGDPQNQSSPGWFRRIFR